MGERQPGPLCVSVVGRNYVDGGTSSITRSATPGPSTSVAGLSMEDKLREVIQRAAPLLPGETGQQLLAMISPESIMIMSGTLLAWAGSHMFGVGEIVDLILLVLGFAVLGMSIITGASELAEFVRCTMNAQSSSDLDRAARHLARAVAILGISTISTLLMAKNVHSVMNRKPPTEAYLLKRGLLEVDPPPPRGVKPGIERPWIMPRRSLGSTDWYGNIKVVRTQTFEQQRITLHHEWVHSVLSPRVAPLRQLRASLKASGYHRSALLRYLEEAMAEAWGRGKVQGIVEGIKALSFPIGPDSYVTISQLASEGAAIGSIDLLGAMYTVYVVDAPYTEPQE
jgi:hypothetical protein